MSNDDKDDGPKMYVGLHTEQPHYEAAIADTSGYAPQASQLTRDLERSVELCRMAREAERKSVVRLLRSVGADWRATGPRNDKSKGSLIESLATLIEAGDHVRNEFGAKDDR